MLNSIFDKFYFVHKNFYNIVEGVHNEALLSLLPSRLSAKDTSLISTIAQHEAQGLNFSATIAKAVFTEPNAFSNHLLVLERLDIVERSKDEIDKRRVLIRLTPFGRELHQKLDAYYIGLLKHLQSNFSFFQLVALYRIIIQVHNQINDKKLPPPSIFNLKRLKNDFNDTLIKIFYVFNEEETEIIAKSDYPNLTLNECRFLMLVYYYEQQKGAFSIEIADELSLPYSTSTSLIKALITKGVLNRIQSPDDGRRFPLSIVPKVRPFIEHHMQYRIDNYQKTLGKLGKGQQQLAAKGFSLIEDYAKAHLLQKSPK